MSYPRAAHYHAVGLTCVAQRHHELGVDVDGNWLGERDRLRERQVDVARRLREKAMLSAKSLRGGGSDSGPSGLRP